MVDLDESALTPNTATFAKALSQMFLIRSAFDYTMAMQGSSTPARIAVIGTGIAGAACALALRSRGLAVHAFDKSRGAGGRLATRRVEWLDAGGQPRVARLDHGAPGFTVRSRAGLQWARSAVAAGWLSEWHPVAAPRGLPLNDEGARFVPVPDMPAACRQLLAGVDTTFGHAIDRLQRSAQGWQLQSGGQVLADGFDAVVLALPPAQAAALLAPHRRDWAQRASLALMQPCWTLLGVARAPAHARAWDVARPADGHLAWVARNEARPGRSGAAGETHWVAHARAGWSRQQLEQAPASVQRQLQDALDEFLGERVHWQQANVHRWRYATSALPCRDPAGDGWWDAQLGLGACGDFLGSHGVEGAWLSAQTLAAQMLQHAPAASACAA
jgi:predicted NAD/FAD-dependent oxidoreductase